jgi:hypothetical protein
LPFGLTSVVSCLLFSQLLSGVWCVSSVLVMLLFFFFFKLRVAPMS